MSMRVETADDRELLLRPSGGVLGFVVRVAVIGALWILFLYGAWLLFTLIPSTWSAESLGAAIFVLFLSVLGLLATIVYLSPDRVRRLRIYGEAARLEATRSAGLWGTESLEVSLTDLVRAHLETIPTGRYESGTYPMRLELFEEAGRVFDEPLVVEEIDQPEEVVDLVFHLGRVLGLEYYRIERFDPRGAAIQLLRSEEEDAESIPEELGPTCYEEDKVHPSARLKPVAEAFDPETLSEPTRVEKWEEKKRLILQRPEREWNLVEFLVPIVCFVALTGGTIWLGLGNHIRPYLLIVGGGLAGLFAVLTGLTFWSTIRARRGFRCDIDGSERTIDLQQGNRTRTYDFDEADAVEIQRLPRKTEGIRVLLDLSEGLSVFLAAFETYDEALSFAAALATLLEVPVTGRKKSGRKETK